MKHARIRKINTLKHTIFHFYLISLLFQNKQGSYVSKVLGTAKELVLFVSPMANTYQFKIVTITANA